MAKSEREGEYSPALGFRSPSSPHEGCIGRARLAGLFLASCSLYLAAPLDHGRIEFVICLLLMVLIVLDLVCYTYIDDTET